VMIVGFSCLMAFAMSAWVFMAGFGLIVAFLTYALGGSTLVVALSGIALALSSSEDMADEMQLAVN